MIRLTLFGVLWTLLGLQLGKWVEEQTGEGLGGTLFLALQTIPIYAVVGWMLLDGIW